jgi:hypothetical protein
MLNAKCVIIIVMLFSSCIKAGEYSIVPRNVQVILRHSDLQKKYPIINACKKALLDSDQIILLINWLRTDKSIDNFDNGKRFPAEILIKIFTFVNLDKFMFAGYLSQASVNLIKTRSIKFSDFIVQLGPESEFQLDIMLNPAINNEVLEGKIDEVLSKLKENEFLPTTILPFIRSCYIDKNDTGEIKKFSILLPKNEGFLKHGQAQMSLISKKLSYYRHCNSSRSQYPRTFKDMNFSDVIRSLYWVNTLRFVVVELIDEHVVDSSSIYDPEFHDPKFEVATNHRILVFDTALGKYDDDSAIQKIQLPTFLKENCRYEDTSVPFMSCRYTIIDIINQTLILHETFTDKFLCFSSSSNNKFITCTEDNAGINEKGWQVTARGSRIGCTIC